MVALRRQAVRHAATPFEAPGEHEVAFLFSGDRLVDATPAARAQLPAEPAEASDLLRLVIAYGNRFSGLAERLESCAEGERFEIAEAADDPESLRLTVERQDGLVRLGLVDPLRETRSGLVTHYSLAALRAELMTLRSIAERSPIPTWKRRQDGAIIWANASYMALARQIAGDEALVGWPPPDLFAVVSEAADGADEQPVRVALDQDSGRARAVGNNAGPARSGRRDTAQTETENTLWFDLIAVPGEVETLYFALPIDRVVKAETALTAFVQTLTKTFAHLSIGLAVFDRQRRLVLFNPALADLTGLPPDQLSTRPTLHAFLDALRDRQRIPEPKDYRSWRLQIAQLEAGATDGTFEQTWYLPNGQTFKVSGRPHPDGAVAYLFEDISSEMSMTRSFRSEIALSQSVVDSLDTAVAAFSQTGHLLMSNRAYCELWQTAPDHAEARPGIGEETTRWRARCKPTQVWATVRRIVTRPEERLAWTGEVETQTARRLRCDVRPLSGGATLVSFSPISDDGPATGSTPAAQAIA